MSDLANFSVRMDKRSVAIIDAMNTLKKDTAKAVHASLRHNTPVDVGTAVSNWQVKADAPAASVLVARVPGRFGSTRSGNISKARRSANSQINVIRPGQNIHITNNVDYIEKLDKGSPRHAPRGFSKFAVRAGVTFIKSKKTRIVKAKI